MATTDTTPGARLQSMAAYDRYDDAQTLVDRLADRGFPVDQLLIVGRDLQLVERVAGKLNATLAGAGYGAGVGLLFGLVFAPTGISLLAIVVYWLAVGTFVGALFGLLTYLIFNRGRRNFTSETGIQARRYEVLAPETSPNKPTATSTTPPTLNHTKGTRP